MGIKVIFVDDHEIFHECVKALFDQQDDMEILAVAADGRTAVKMANELSPDVVVMDISMPSLNGIDATRMIVGENPRVKVVALSMHSERKVILDILQAGAKGYVLKESAFSELVMAIRSVAAGKIYLSPSIASVVLDDYLALAERRRSNCGNALSSREREVLQLLAEGKSARLIAETLNLSVKTIETHRAQIMNKLDIHSLPELTKYAIREGLTSLSF